MDITIAPTHTITVAEAARALDVSERTVWRYLKSGRLPGETVGEPGSQRTLIPRAAVERLRLGRGPGEAALRAELDRLGEELAARTAERDALRLRVMELQRLLAATRPSRAEPLARRARVLALQATELTASLRARWPSLLG